MEETPGYHEMLLKFKNAFEHIDADGDKLVTKEELDDFLNSEDEKGYVIFFWFFESGQF